MRVTGKQLVYLFDLYPTLSHRLGVPYSSFSQFHSTCTCCRAQLGVVSGCNHRNTKILLWVKHGHYFIGYSQYIGLGWGKYLSAGKKSPAPPCPTAEATMQEMPHYLGPPCQGPLRWQPGVCANLWPLALIPQARVKTLRHHT